MGGIDKVFAEILGRPLLAWTIDVFERSPLVDEIVVAIDKDRIHEGRMFVEANDWKKVSQVCRGGVRRQDSIREALWRIGKCDWVMVHDGARPCISESLLERAMEAAQTVGVAIPALPVTDTLKRTDAAGLVQATVEREGLWSVQTPQLFRYDILWAAHEQAQDATDDAAMVERLGKPVRLFTGDPDNIKVTVKEDLPRAAAILQEMLAARNV